MSKDKDLPLCRSLKSMWSNMKAFPQKCGEYLLGFLRSLNSRWRIVFVISFVLTIIVIFFLGFYIFSEVKEGTITVFFDEGAYEDGSQVALVPIDLLDNPGTWKPKEVWDNRPVEFPNTRRAVDGTPPDFTEDYIEYKIIIMARPENQQGQSSEKKILYKSPAFTLKQFGYLKDIKNEMDSQEKNDSGQDSADPNSTSSGESTASDSTEVQNGVDSIARRPENEKHYWLFVFLATAFVFFTRGFYALAFQVRRIPNWLIAFSEAVFFCIIALIIEEDFDLSRLSPKISDWITRLLNSLFFQITSAGVIGVILLSLVAEIFKELWNGVKSHASQKENAWQDFKNHRLSLLYHNRFQIRLLKGDRLFIANSVFVRFILWFVGAAGTFVLLILLKKDSQMFTGSLYVFLFGVTVGVAGFTLHLIATQASILRAEYRYLSLKQTRLFFDRYPSAAADYYQVLANLFIGRTPIRSEEVAYHNHDICTGVLNSRFGKVQIAANLVNAYDDTIKNFQADDSQEMLRSEYTIASRMYDMLIGDLDSNRCAKAQSMIKIAYQCMFDNEKSKNNWRNLLSGSKTTLEQVRAISLLEFFRRINESDLFGEIGACPLKWKCGDCYCIHPPQKAAQPPHKHRSLLRTNRKPPQAPSAVYAALLIEFPYILALSIKKKFSKEAPLISEDEFRVIVENYFFNLFVNDDAKKWYRFDQKGCIAIAADVDRFFECIGEEPPWKDSGKYLNRILPETTDINYDCVEIHYLVDSNSRFPENYCPNLSREGWPSLSLDNKYSQDRVDYLRRLSIQYWADTRVKRLTQLIFFSPTNGITT